MNLIKGKGRDIESYIKFIYNIDPDAFKGWKMYDQYIEHTKDLIEAIFVKMEKLEDADLKAYVPEISEAMKWCPDRQIATLTMVYSALYSKKPANTLESFVENEIAVLKEYIFDMLVTPGNGTQNVHVLNYWKYQLRDELGFNVNYKPRMGTFGQDKFGGHHGNALDAFYTKFTPNYVIGKLMEEINEEKKRPGMEASLVALCGKMLLEGNTDDIEYTKRMFECENDEVAKNLMFKKITKEGVREVLLKMGILEKAVS